MLLRVHKEQMHDQYASRVTPLKVLHVLCTGMCTWQAYMIASSCRADSRPFLIVDSGMDRVYVMSGGGTLDRVFVSTTMSG